MNNGTAILGIAPAPTPDEVEAQRFIADMALLIAADVSHIIGSLRAPVGMGMPPPAAVSAHLGRQSARRFMDAVLAALDRDRTRNAATRLRVALQAQQLAEEHNANCAVCGGEGDWAHCERCSIYFGKAIDMRHRALELK